MLRKNSEQLDPCKVKDFVSRISNRHAEEYGMFDYKQQQNDFKSAAALET